MSNEYTTGKAPSLPPTAALRLSKCLFGKTILARTCVLIVYESIAGGKDEDGDLAFLNC